MRRQPLLLTPNFLSADRRVSYRTVPSYLRRCQFVFFVRELGRLHINTFVKSYGISIVYEVSISSIFYLRRLRRFLVV